MLQNNKQLNILMLLSAFYMFFFSPKKVKNTHFSTSDTFAHFAISPEARLAWTNIRADIVLAVGVDVTDGGRNIALVDIWKRNEKKKKQSDAERYMNLSKLAVLMLKKMHVFCQFRSRVFEKLESITGTQEAVIKTMIIILVPLHVLPFPLKPGLHKQT